MFLFSQDSLQPGCFGVVCSHSRSYQYYAESVYPGYEQNFLAAECHSMKAVKLGRCVNNITPMGYATPSRARGNYYLETRYTTPYGMNYPSEGVWPFRYVAKPKCQNL